MTVHHHTREYTYGNNNELREVRIPLGVVTIPNYTWNRPATVNFPGGTQRSYTYDALMRLQSLSVTDPSSNSILDYSYTYDSIGNIETKTTEHGTYTYGYDDMSRLLTANHPVLDDESYTYDDVGNRLTDSSVSGSWSYNTNNELLGYADVEYEYDANGNLAEVRVAGQMIWTCVYDAANRLVHVEDGTGTISADYYYDPFGRRLWKDVGGTKTYFFYSEEGLIAEYDATGMEIKSYGYKPDSTWTTDPLWLKEGGTYYWYQNDHLGTPQKLVATDGTVVWSAQYTAFGEAVIDVELVENNLRFPGQYEDVETGLHYNLQRYYAPQIGRYLQKDPMSFFGGTINLYGYASNNPLKRNDPYGLGLMEEVIDRPLTPEETEWLETALNSLGKGGPGLIPTILKLGGKAGLCGLAAMGIVMMTPYPVGITPDGVLEEEEFAEVLAEPARNPQFSWPNTGESCCEDEAGESCSCRELGPIILYAVRPGQAPGVEIGHAFVAWRSSWEIGVEAWGWTFIAGSANSVTDPKVGSVTDPKVGMAVSNMDLILAAEPLRVYQVCPETMKKLDDSISNNKWGIYQVQNIGGKNCFGWAFQVIQDAELSPPRSPDMIFEPSAPVPPNDQHAKEVFFTQIGQFINQLIDAIQRGIP